MTPNEQSSQQIEQLTGRGEQHDYQQTIEKTIKGKKRFNDRDIESILLNIINRKRMKYGTRDMINYMCKCICLRNVRKSKKSLKKEFIYAKAQNRLLGELDVITLLKSIRQVKLLTQVLLSQSQKMVLRFQRKNLIETSSSSQDSDDQNKFSTVRLMECYNPMIRLVIFGKLKRMIKAYKKRKLTSIDRRLFRGLFVKHLKDFDEDYYEGVQNKSLLMRLKHSKLKEAAA